MRWVGPVDINPGFNLSSYDIHTDSCPCMWTVPVNIMGSLWPRSRLQSPLRILSDAPKFRAECLQTLRDGEVEEESAAPPSVYATVTTPLVHDFIIFLTGEFGPYLEGKGRRFTNSPLPVDFCCFGLVAFSCAQRRVAATTRTVVSSPWRRSSTVFLGNLNYGKMIDRVSTSTHPRAHTLVL